MATTIERKRGELPPAWDGDTGATGPSVRLDLALELVSWARAVRRLTSDPSRIRDPLTTRAEALAEELRGSRVQAAGAAKLADQFVLAGRLFILQFRDDETALTAETLMALEVLEDRLGAIRVPSGGGHAARAKAYFATLPEAPAAYFGNGGAAS